MDLIRKMMDRRSYLRITINDILKNQIVSHFITEFNYDSLILNLSSYSSPTSSQNQYSLLPFSSNTVLVESDHFSYRNVIEKPTVTNDEFSRSIPLAIKYSPQNSRSRKNSKSMKNIKTKNKFFIILFITLACIQLSNMIFYFLHLILISLLLMLSLRYIQVLYTLPILVGIETIFSSSNSCLLPVLVLILIIFIIG